ncbi:thiamine-phosphate kinase [Weeksella virosa]|uniref:Thiamine-monophosphate kinase n=1 Tax=Weeksella virosa (strain ATCC 43766 / DSM 16922 / JCM 21250 / CCUG 30538 / CDC 9751 / IAM 14551 / NBRC 16016 / NCTC 11634 / CL345/78) TaxID=865938 RepID=F0P169_WEEVC|nr:thiamine-phosphate kinase [Weeksella virosa]ADX67568.1 thiamine-monophosphate kinase [Weeksella virosa DSM 16922]VEH64810.1 Thiamine-monophosphate kinase [Weeksella virosa]
MLDDKKISKTSLDELGEFGLIEQIALRFPPKLTSTLQGIGDDAAVIDYKDEKTLVTSEIFIEGIHFRWDYMPLRHLGYKITMATASDLIAMNAKPQQLLVNIALSNRFTIEAVDEIYNGIKYACDQLKMDVVGGDTTSSTRGLCVSLTAIGSAKEEKILYRKGAKPKDLLVVTGDLGGAFLGLQVLEREAQVNKVNPNNQPDFSNYTYLIERQLKPQARIDILELLKELDVQPTSMIDISDGLSSEVLHLAKENGLGMNIYEEKIPLDPSTIRTAEEFNINPITCALSGGEDFELLFTIKQKDFDKIKGNPNFSIIGYVGEEKEGSFLITKGNEQKVPLVAQGWREQEA